jgi:hypothetical protein
LHHFIHQFVALTPVARCTPNKKVRGQQSDVRVEGQRVPLPSHLRIAGQDRRNRIQHSAQHGQSHVAQACPAAGIQEGREVANQAAMKPFETLN